MLIKLAQNMECTSLGISCALRSTGALKLRIEETVRILLRVLRGRVREKPSCLYRMRVMRKQTLWMKLSRILLTSSQ
jgi:hypothetical protein